MNERDRVAIVTGSARGIGAAIARRLSSDGLAVAVLDLDESECKATVHDIEGAGGRAMAVGSRDVADEASVTEAVQRVAQELGAPTVLGYNAGITRDNFLFKMSTADWDAVMNVHLRGSFLMSRATQEYMVKARWGRIVNLSSVSALGNRGQTNYSAAKAGIEGFTKTLAMELGKFGVTANAIAPGYIESDMTVKMAARMGIAFEDLKDRSSTRHPSRESVSPTTSPLPRPFLRVTTRRSSPVRSSTSPVVRVTNVLEPSRERRPRVPRAAEPV